MSYTIDTFRDLIQRFPSWSSFSSYITSPEGGSLRIIQKGPELAIVRYVKGVSDLSKEHVRHFRSVVWNTRTHRPVCVAPVKSENDQAPTSVIAADETYCSYFMDGSMVSLFGSRNRCTSRSSLDCRSSFYTHTPMATLVAEARQITGMGKAFPLAENQFVNMVLQHPEHRIVCPVRKPQLFITHVGTIEADGRVVVTYSSREFPAWARPFAPRSFRITHADAGDSYRVKGYIIQETGTPRRWRVINPDYERVRELRGSESNAAERFLRLRKDGRIKEYISVYPEEKDIFWGFEKKFREQTKALYDAYVDLNKTKKKTMKELPFAFRTPVYTLHGTYLASFKEQGSTPAKVDKSVVIDYVNNLPIIEQVKILEAVPLTPPATEASSTDSASGSNENEQSTSNVV